MTQELTFKQLQLISHSLGVDLFKSVMSLKKKDKVLPPSFYRNYFNAKTTHSEYPEIKLLVDTGLMETTIENYYNVTDEGIAVFKKSFYDKALYKSPAEMDLDYLRHRINFYCQFYNYNFCQDNSEHILFYYENYFVAKHFVSHTTKDVIIKFKRELRQWYTAKQRAENIKVTLK